MGGALVAAGSVGTGQVAGQESDVVVSVDNRGFTAWEVTGVDGADNVAPTGEGNPTLTPRIGTRDTFDNETCDLVETDGGEDGPGTDADGTVTASAEVTVDAGTDPGGDDSAPDGDDGDDASSDGSGPGFGTIAGLAGLKELASYAHRKRQRNAERSVATVGA